MKTSSFYFDLPADLIAQQPAKRRELSRLLILNRHEHSIEHHRFHELPQLLKPPLVIVLNDTRVRKARIFGSCGGKQIEFLLLERQTDLRWLCLCGRKQKSGMEYLFPADITGIIKGQEPGLKQLEFSRAITEDYLEQYAHVPLPPYIKRADNRLDEERYQTVFSAQTGSAAAPTAGLHFTPAILQELQARGITLAFITLHVGLGTFQPVRSENVEEHKMHSENFHLTAATARQLTAAKQNKVKILCVGTTVVRCLESAWADGYFRAGAGATDIFIYPPYCFQAVDHLITNFHTPLSSLLMLVCAFAGKACIEETYQTAIAKRYRFFSYGDAMLIL